MPCDGHVAWSLSFWTFARLIFQFSPRQINVPSVLLWPNRLCFRKMPTQQTSWCLWAAGAESVARSPTEGTLMSPWESKSDQAEGSELTLRLWWLCSAVSSTLIFYFYRFSLTLIDTLDTLVVRFSLFFSAFKHAGTFERLYDFMFFQPPLRVTLRAGVK